MIPLALALELKEAGLVWQTKLHDFFAIPDRDLNDRIFVLSDVMATMSLLRGWPAVMFHGTAEWALDYILTHEVVWMPTEGQLRQELEKMLRGEDHFDQLSSSADGYECRIVYQGESLVFTAVSAAEAYAAALLQILKQS